jgi:hypothetical protein
MAFTNFNINPAFTPIPTPAAWLYSNFQQTGTTNSTTTVSALSVGTSFLVVGQPVSGSGIPAGTTIATISSGTQIILSQAATASASGVTLTFGTAPGVNSAFSNNAFFGVPAPTATDVPGCAFAIPELQTINAGAVFIPAPGYGIMLLGTGTTTASSIQYQTASGTWTSFFTGSTSAGTYFQGINCDGGNVRVNIAGSAAATFTFYRFRSFPTL